jgi:hypothetical protein
MEAKRMIGIHTDWTMAQYLELEALSASGVEALINGGKWGFYKRFLDPERERKETKSLNNGELLHTFILEPERFEDEYLRGPDVDDKRKKEWRDAKAEAESSGKQILDNDTFKWLYRCRDEIKAHPFAAAALLSPGESEKTVVWEESGIRCKARIDRCLKNIIIDLKSTRDASDNGFEREAARYRYDIKAAWYLRAARQYPELQQKHFGMVAIEIEYPSLCNVFVYEPAQLVKAERQIERAMLSYADGIKNGWKRDDLVVKSLRLPKWLEAMDDD